MSYRSQFIHNHLTSNKLGKADSRRITAIGGQNLYEEFVKYFICSHRHDVLRAKNQTPKVPPTTKPFLIKPLEVTRHLTGLHCLRLYPDPAGRPVQNYFVVRLREENDLLPRFGRIIDVLGTPSVTFGKSYEETGLGARFVDLFYFLDRPETGEVCEPEGRPQFIPANKSLLDLLSTLRSNSRSRSIWSDPIRLSDMHPWFYACTDAQGVVHRVQPANNVSLGDLIIQAKRGVALEHEGAWYTRCRRAGLIPRIDQHLAEQGLDLEEMNAVVLPTTNTPLDLPLTDFLGASRLLDPESLAPVAMDVPGALRALFDGGGPPLLSLEDILPSPRRSEPASTEPQGGPKAPEGAPPSTGKAWSPDIQGLLLADIEKIFELDLWITARHNGKDVRYRDYVAEQLAFQAWQLHEAALQNNRDAMIRSNYIHALPGLTKQKEKTILVRLARIGIGRYGLASKSKRRAYFFSRAANTLPDADRYDGERVQSLDEGIRRLRLRADIEKLYSRWHMKKIMRRS